MLNLIFTKDNKLSYNTDAISNMQGKISEASSALQSLNSDIRKAIDTMEKDWQTTEGKKFLQSINLDWSKQVDQYVKILDTLDVMLRDSHTIYSELTEKAKMINYGD